MKFIAVTGGKGGTGKSTVAIMMALEKITAGEKVLLVDCDVECPNDYILLGIDKLVDPIQNTYVTYPHINKDKCKKCGLCVDKCRSKALFQPQGDIPYLNKDLCSSCGVCWTICPNDAIEKIKQKNGEIFKNIVNSNLTLVTGRSLSGVRETSSVVEKVKNFVDILSSDYDTIIIDTAAGTHCTVLKALEGVEKAYAVTEPTKLGAHDLMVILEVLKKLNISSEIILNKSGVGGEDLITMISQDFKVEIARRISYRKEFAELYSEGNLINSKDELLNLNCKV